MCVRPRASCQPGSFRRWLMSCSSGSKGDKRGAKTAVRTTSATTANPNSAVRRLVKRRISATHSRSLNGRGGASTTESCATPGWLVMASSADGRHVASPESDPRIEIGIDDVHEEVHDHERARQQEDGRLHDRVVAVEDRLHGEAADSRPREDRLG